MKRQRVLILTVVSMFTVIGLVAAFSTKAIHTEFVAGVYAGSCEEPASEPSYELIGPTYGLTVAGTPVSASPEAFTISGDPGSHPVVTSTTVIDATIDDLLESPHVVILRIIEEDSGTDVRLACGRVGGVVTGPDLSFGLAAETAQTTGIVWLHDNGDGTTTVTFFVAQALFDETVTPSAPTDEEAASPPPATPDETEVIEEGPDEAATAGDVERGQQLAAQCVACHSVDGSTSVGPTWQGLYGSTRPLADGSEVVADEAYLEESIRNPSAKVVAGFPAIMPGFGHLPDEDIAALIEYIKSLE